MSTICRSCRSSLSRLYSLGRPSATVCVLRTPPAGGIECLLLLKSQQQRFGGLWVFPGGSIDSADEAIHSDSGDMDILQTAANAAARELHEEACLSVREEIAFISHWVPPSSETKTRGKGFSTFFFAGALDTAQSSQQSVVQVDGGEIVQSLWLAPDEALRQHAAGELPLLPPTWLTLESLRACEASSADEALTALRAAPPLAFQTRSSSLPDGRLCFMWEGDAGWESADPTLPGPRFRLLSVDVANGGDGEERMHQLARTRLVLEQTS